MRIIISKFRIKVWFPSRTKYFKKDVFSHSIRLKGIKSIFSQKLKQLLKRKMLTLKTLKIFLWYCLNMKHPFCLISEEEKYPVNPRPNLNARTADICLWKFSGHWTTWGRFTWKVFSGNSQRNKITKGLTWQLQTLGKMKYVFNIFRLRLTISFIMLVLTSIKRKWLLFLKNEERRPSSNGYWLALIFF